jgi:hypothetical protein
MKFQQSKARKNKYEIKQIIIVQNGTSSHNECLQYLQQVSSKTNMYNNRYNVMSVVP